MKTCDVCGDGFSPHELEQIDEDGEMACLRCRRKLREGEPVIVNGNREARFTYDDGLGMWNVRMWAGTRHVGDVIVPEEEVHPL